METTELLLQTVAVTISYILGYLIGAIVNSKPAQNTTIINPDWKLKQTVERQDMLIAKYDDENRKLKKKLNIK